MQRCWLGRGAGVWVRIVVVGAPLHIAGDVGHAKLVEDGAEQAHGCYPMARMLPCPLKLRQRSTNVSALEQREAIAETQIEVERFGRHQLPKLVHGRIARVLVHLGPVWSSESPKKQAPRRALPTR